VDIVGWEIVFVLVGGILALIRGHHVFVGMFVSLFLGPIGWLLVLVVKPKPRRREAVV
jgi:hypothetical protein